MLTVHHVNAFLVIAVCAASAVAAFWARRRGRAGERRLASARARADARRRAGRARAAAAVRPQPRGRPAPLRLRHVRAARRALARGCTRRPTRARGCSGSRRDARRRRARRARLHDRMRNIPLRPQPGDPRARRAADRRAEPGDGARDRRDAAALRVLHRDRRRRLLRSGATSGAARSSRGRPRAAVSSTARSRSLVVDLGWYLLRSLTGRDLLAFFVVLAVCVYVGVRTWRDQRSVL